MGRYGADSEMGRYLENHDGSCDYEDTNNQTDIAAYKVFAKDNIVREKQGGISEPLSNFGTKYKGGWKTVSRK